MTINIKNTGNAYLREWGDGEYTEYPVEGSILPHLMKEVNEIEEGTTIRDIFNIFIGDKYEEEIASMLHYSGIQTREGWKRAIRSFGVEPPKSIFDSVSSDSIQEDITDFILDNFADDEEIVEYLMDRSFDDFENILSRIDRILDHEDADLDDPDDYGPFRIYPIPAETLNKEFDVEEAPYFMWGVHVENLDPEGFPYSFSHTPICNYAHFPVELDRKMRIFDGNDMEEIVSFERTEISLIQLIYSIVYDITFYGLVSPGETTPIDKAAEAYEEYMENQDASSTEIEVEDHPDDRESNNN